MPQLYRNPMNLKYSLLTLSVVSGIAMADIDSSSSSELNTLPDWQNGHFYLGARAGWAAYQDACDSNALECDEDDFGYGLYAGYQFNDWFALEAGVTDYGEASALYPPSSGIDSSKQRVSTDTYGAELAAKLSYRLSSEWEVFTRLGASYLDIDKTSDWAGDQSSQDWNAMMSVGIDYRLSQRWSVRGEYQFIDGIGDSTVDQADLHFTSVGLTYHFGQEEVPIVAPEPLPVVVAEPVLVTENVTLSADAQFGFDSSILKVNQDLSSLSGQLSQYDSGSIRIIGHTDSRGSEEYNQALSEKRAQAVADYLVGKGVSPERLTVEGMGESQPVADNATAEGRAENRRVEIEFETIKETLVESVEGVE